MEVKDAVFEWRKCRQFPDYRQLQAQSTNIVNEKYIRIEYELVSKAHDEMEEVMGQGDSEGGAFKVTKK